MKLAVDFTSAAIKDLSDIASYKADTWGREQAISYAGLLNGHFIEIAEGRIFSKVPFSKYPNVRVCRCEHTIFSLYAHRKASSQ
ncbi:type II toxin-antitoxin system RelE/ParE family toxin [Methylicorpusculum oleiharenae]|uniref:type II toxin-antitoxin system RelE/ParE family toxin n=1 Tax=Methylicorpusculum oleiharenae TaxID=1338687 RepID=UPI00135789FC|nr:type II toxin-antitoxin system RelE/ParE family toxin [Methylicorpusculum oleiharenae]MCD2448852.1 type II toxin-antitoxin system RelE/ParE family toxin [Methylicorpusculum oleiharenae]